MDLRFYNFDLDFLHQTPKSRSRWEIKYNGIGSAEITLPLNEPFTKEIIKNIKSGIIVTQGQNSAMIIGCDIQEAFVLYGRPLNWILNKRVVEQFEATTDTPTNLSVNWVVNAFSDCPNFVIGNIPTVDDIVTVERSSDVILFDLVSETLKLKKLGFEVVPDWYNKKWVFNILQSYEQEFVPSQANRNVYNSRITIDTLDYANGGYYLAKTTDAETGDVITTRRYIGGPETGLNRWEAILNADAESTAAEELSLKRINDEVSFALKNLKYGTDYKLGDIMTIQISKGSYSSLYKRMITGIELTYDNNGAIENPTFEEV